MYKECSNRTRYKQELLNRDGILPKGDSKSCVFSAVSNFKTVKIYVFYKLILLQTCHVFSLCKFSLSFKVVLGFTNITGLAYGTSKLINNILDRSRCLILAIEETFHFEHGESNNNFSVLAKFLTNFLSFSLVAREECLVEGGNLKYTVLADME